MRLYQKRISVEKNTTEIPGCNIVMDQGDFFGEGGGSAQLYRGGSFSRHFQYTDAFRILFY